MNHQNAIQTNKRPTAIRLVSTKDMSRQEWLTVRNQGIGASDAAAAIGISPYQSRLELWMIKTGRMSSELTNADFSAKDTFTSLTPSTSLNATVT